MRLHSTEFVAPGVIIHLRAFSDSNPRKEGNTGPAVSGAQVRKAFSEGWMVKSLEHKGIDAVLSEDEKREAYA